MEEQVYIGRQMVVDTKRELVGFELFYRHNPDIETDGLGVCAEANTIAITNTLVNLGAKWLMADKVAFIGIDHPMIDSGAVDTLPPANFILELDRNTQLLPDSTEKMSALKNRGFMICLDDFIATPDTLRLLEFASYIKLDTRDIQNVNAVMTTCEGRGVKFIAKKVETQQAFQWCIQAGFSHFQGGYFATAETLSAKSVHPSVEIILGLMNKIRDPDTETAELLSWFKRDPTLSFKLFRYINSVGFGLSTQISSLPHALNILGRTPLYKWLTMLFATAGSETASPAIIRLAITRGRMMELMGSGIVPKADIDNLFVVGVFSMLDALLGMPIDKAIEDMNLSEEIEDALLHGTGLYWPFLETAKISETDDCGRLENLSAALMMNPDKVNSSQLAALVWTEQLFANLN